MYGFRNPFILSNWPNFFIWQRDLCMGAILHCMHTVMFVARELHIYSCILVSSHNAQFYASGNGPTIHVISPSMRGEENMSSHVCSVKM